MVKFRSATHSILQRGMRNMRSRVVVEKDRSSIDHCGVHMSEFFVYFVNLLDVLLCRHCFAQIQETVGN